MGFGGRLVGGVVWEPGLGFDGESVCEWGFDTVVTCGCGGGGVLGRE